MRKVTVEKTLYKFEELSEKAKYNAMEKLSPDYEWWNSIYEDAKNVGCKIEGFGLDGRRSIDFSFSKDVESVADLIMSEHGETCGTFKLAKEFVENRNALVVKYSDGIDTNVVAEDNEYDFDNECDELEEDFRQALGEEYLSMLDKEYEYQSSEEYIKEMCDANKYEFDENGNLA